MVARIERILAVISHAVILHPDADIITGSVSDGCSTARLTGANRADKGFTIGDDLTRTSVIEESSIVKSAGRVIPLNAQRKRGVLDCIISLPSRVQMPGSNQLIMTGDLCPSGFPCIGYLPCFRIFPVPVNPEPRVVIMYAVGSVVGYSLRSEYKRCSMQNIDTIFFINFDSNYNFTYVVYRSLPPVSERIDPLPHGSVV